MKKWRLIPHILGRCHWENDDQTWDGGTLDPIPGFHRACDSEQPIIIPQLLPHQRPAMDNRWHWQEQLKGEDSTTGESHMIPSDLQIWHGLTSTLQHVVLRYLESKNGRRPKNSKIHSQNQSNCCSTMGFVWALYFPNKSIFFCSIIVQRIICPRPPRGSRSFCPPRPFRGDVSPMGPAYQKGSIYIPWELSPTMVLLDFFSPKFCRNQTISSKTSEEGPMRGTQLGAPAGWSVYFLLPVSRFSSISEEDSERIV